MEGAGLRKRANVLPAGTNDGRILPHPVSFQRSSCAAVLILGLAVISLMATTLSIRQLASSYLPTASKKNEWMVQELPNDMAFVDEKMCRENPSLMRCGPADIILYMKGDLDVRLYSMCVADAYSQLTEAKLRLLWTQDDKIPHAKFGDLLNNDEFDPQEDLEEFKPPEHYVAHEVQSSVCTEALTGTPASGWEKRTLTNAPWPDKTTMPAVTLLLNPSLQSWPGWEDPPSCDLQQAARQCWRSLQPGDTVEALMLHENMARLRRSTGVYIQAGAHRPKEPLGGLPRPIPECFGCPDALLLNCTIRRLTMDFLRDPSLDFSVGGHWAADAVAASDSFVPDRAPLLLTLTADRNEHCPGPPALNPVPLQAPENEEKTQQLRFMDHATRVQVAAGGGSRAEQERGGEGGAGGRLRWLRFGRKQAGNEGFGFRAQADKEKTSLLQDSLAKAGVGLSQTGALGPELRARLGFLTHSRSQRRLLAGQEEGEVASEDELTPLQTIRCLQYQLAELFLLGYTGGLLHSFPSPATEFIIARIRPDDSSYAPETSVCNAPAIPPITKQRFASQFFVDEKIKALYCSIPKVACTSWKVWFRQVAGLPHPEDAWIAHDPAKSGLKELWWSYQEHEAIRVVTRPDLFRFTFTRNPFSRLLSVYLDKHVNGGPPYNRKHWNKKFFSGLGRVLPEVQQRADPLPLGEFVDLVGAVMTSQRASIEPHIAPQLDLCQLSSIKYDFVGRFEALEADLAVVMARLGTEPGTAFALGKQDHPTRADERMLKFYDQDVYNTVKQVLAMDFEIPFNNISYKPPQVLAALFEKGLQR